MPTTSELSSRPAWRRGDRATCGSSASPTSSDQFTDQVAPNQSADQGARPTLDRPTTPVVAIVDGGGLAELLTRAGAVVLDPATAGAAEGAALRALVADQSGDAIQPVLLPGSVEAWRVAHQVADRDQRVRVVDSRSAVQVIAALAVHDPAREPGADLLAMATAAAGCRDGLVEIAEGDGVTSAGLCHRGDILGHVDGDVALIGSDIDEVAAGVLDRLLGGGGELVTLVIGQPADPGLGMRVAAALRGRRRDVDITTYDGGQPSSYLLVGVE